MWFVKRFLFNLFVLSLGFGFFAFLYWLANIGLANVSLIILGLLMVAYASYCQGPFDSD